MSLPRDLEFRVTPIPADEVPALQWPKPPSRYDALLDRFLEKGVEVARVDADWPEDTTVGEVESVATGLKLAIKRRRMGDKVTCFRRRGDVYLAKVYES